MSKKNFRILIIDDEKSFLLLLTKILKDAGYTVQSTAEPEDAINIVDSFAPNLVITDLKMPKIDGITLMERIKERFPEVDFIMITAFATVDTAVTAMKKGAVDYITKPLKDPEELRIAVSKIYDRQRLLIENRLLKSEAIRDIPPVDTIFLGMENVLREIYDVADTDSTVIIYGETGTGKTLIAKVVHHLSQRPGLFVEINCAAIPDNLLESELFGYEKGAFTGALSQKKGKFELAIDGTIFLDEIAEMAPALQAKLLKVLQDRSFERLGSLITLYSNARVIAATNKDLKLLMEENKFRHDLFYRLNVFPIHIPPLRERKEHIALISDYLINTISARLGKEVKALDEDALNKLLSYNWPGNIRELENVIERSIIVSRGKYLLLPDFETNKTSVSEDREISMDIKDIEKTAIENALLKAGGNRKKTADILGISLRALQYKIKEYGL